MRTVNQPLVHHVTLTVTDPVRSASWYQALLGPAAVIDREGPTWHRLRMQWPTGLVIAVTAHEGTGSDRFDETRVGIDHLGLGCADEAEVRGWHQLLEDLGFEHGPIEDAPYGWAVTARDPDGIAIEFFCAKG